jgi:cysteine synthase A
VILCMLPDTGERYLSTVLFEDITAEMTEEEKAIAASTPRYRFDACAPPPPPVAAEKPKPARPAAIDFVETALAAPDAPVVLFALEWCEFSWAVRKMFAALGIPHRSIDLDSVPYQKDNWGGEIRIALRERIGTPTIPQIFVGKHHIGGATDTFTAYNDGKLQELLKTHGVGFQQKEDLDAHSFMPTWLHPR